MLVYRTSLKLLQRQGRHAISRGLFGFFNKKKGADKTEKKQEKIEDFPSLGPIIENIRLQNDIRERVLPERDPSDKKLTVCFEMDETFLHTFYPDEVEAYLYQPSRKHDYTFDFEEAQTAVDIYLRPGWQELFEYLEHNTEAVIFSRGNQVYVDKVMDIIDPSRKTFKYRIYQDSCNLVEVETENINELVKDLKLLDRDLSRTVLVDTDPFSFWMYPNNCLPIEPFSPDLVGDNKLKEIITKLESLNNADDVRLDLASDFAIERALKESRLL